MTCKDCIHFADCLNEQSQTRYYGLNVACNDVEDMCKHFKDKSRYIELPCKVGDTVYELHDCYSQVKGHHTTIVKHKVTELLYSSKRGVRPWVVCCWGGYRFDNCDFGETVFLTREEAEKAV